MSVEAMQWVFRNSKARGGDRLVLLSLAWHADKEGKNAWPSVERLVGESRLCERAVQYALQRLLAKNRIARTGVSGKRTFVYQIVMSSETSSKLNESKDSLPREGSIEPER